MKIKYPLFILFILASFSACFEDEDPPIPEGIVPELVRQKLDEKKKEYYAERKRICLLDAMVRAEDHVDSIIIGEIKIKIVDTLNFPERPIKPSHPGFIQLDTAKARRIF